jgi:hypothetical protein
MESQIYHIPLKSRASISRKYVPTKVRLMAVPKLLTLEITGRSPSTIHIPESGLYILERIQITLVPRLTIVISVKDSRTIHGVDTKWRHLLCNTMAHSAYCSSKPQHLCCNVSYETWRWRIVSLSVVRSSRRPHLLLVKEKSRTIKRQFLPL